MGFCLHSLSWIPVDLGGNENSVQGPVVSVQENGHSTMYTIGSAISHTIIS